MRRQLPRAWEVTIKFVAPVRIPLHIERRLNYSPGNRRSITYSAGNSMQTATGSLECRSQAQAMDWSLVLISQGIESFMLRREDDGGWMLEIAAHDLDRARESIGAYERENATVWRREVKWAGLIFDARAALWFAAVALFYWLQSNARADLRFLGAVDRTAVLHGEWWRLFTAITLHADIAHLATNVTIGIVFLGLAMACFGAGNALLLSFLGGAVGNVATLLAHDGPFRSLGASGMVMAALGLLTAHSAAVSRHERRAIWIGRGVLAGGLLVVLLGLSPRSDVVAHVGGFAAGVFIGIIAMLFRRLLMQRWTNGIALLLTAALLLGTWWLALHH
jgi:membrane associated rhomboid family serine protease